MNRRSGPALPAAGMMQTKPLSPREREILELRAQGSTIKAIAASLGISRNTVESHMKRIFAKLHARSSLEAVRSL